MGVCGEEKRNIRKSTTNLKNIEEKIVNINKNKISLSFETINKALSIHNNYRKNHGCNSLSLNDTLCDLAREYAKKCANTKNIGYCDDLYNNDIIGQNIAVVNHHYFDVIEICYEWYNVKKNYKFGSNKYIEGTGHFTQLIWKNTKYIGFGYEEDDNGNIYFVANYYPAGNIFNEFGENVPIAYR